jgi:hypothetical protein
MKKKSGDLWFPVWVDKWLFGSTRIELQPDERSVFFDLIVLSKKDDGYIRANKAVPYLENQLCGFLNIAPELLKRTLEKCIKAKKIKKLADGTLFILSHVVYQLSERQKRRLSIWGKKADIMAGKADIMAGKADIMAGKADTRGEDIRGEDIRLDKRRGEERISSPYPPLPAIPKGLEFKVQDELKNRLAEIRDLKRKLANKEFLKNSPASHKDILCKLEQKEKKYRELIEDYS